MSFHRLITIILFCFSSSMFAQIEQPIAVMELIGVGVSSSETRIITSRLRTDLFNTNKFIVVERERMEELLDEQGFQLTGCTSNECVVEAGKLLGVRRIVAGEIGKIGNLFTLSIRMIDVETGKILRTSTVDCKCDIETVLTSSVKNVAEILAGQNVLSSSYVKDEIQGKDQSPYSGNNEWKILGISQEKYIKYKQSGLTFEQWQLSLVPHRKKIYVTSNAGILLTVGGSSSYTHPYIATLISGYNFSESFQFGIGANIVQTRGLETFPLFIDSRYTFSATKVLPYVFLDAGYLFDLIMDENKGVMLNFGLGGKYKFNINYGLTFDLSYRLQDLNYESTDGESYTEQISLLTHSIVITVGLIFE